MKFTLSWLKTHLKTTASLPTILETLNQIGLEVEGVENTADPIRDVVIGHIETATQHPNADRLQICAVRLADDNAPIQVVCGGVNAREGLKVAFAKAGVTIPQNGLTLKTTTIRGIESSGMICAADELCIDYSTPEGGIMELPEEAPIGMALVDYLELDDPVIEISITPNRGDCLSVRGIARDLAAAGIGTLKPFEQKLIEGRFDSPIQFNAPSDARTQEVITRFKGRYIKGVQNKPSPAWLQKRLRSIGLAPISALVDITNFLTFDVGRPAHVYDADKIKGDMTAAPAIPGTEILALNNQTYTLTEEDTVITDGQEALGIAGIIGGESTGCTLATTNVILETAYFDAIAIAEMGRRHNLQTDARFRFERGVDPAFLDAGNTYAAQLILDVCGGEISHPIGFGDIANNVHEISLPHSLIDSLGGISLEAAAQQSFLEKVGCAVVKAAPGHTTYATPSWRHDLTLPEDLVEEVMRLYGYDHIPALPLPALKAPEAPTTIPQRHLSTLSHLLASRGFHEVITWSMCAEKDAQIFGGGAAALKIVNPISEEMVYMRPSLLATMLHAVKRNQARSQERISLFESGLIFNGPYDKDQRLVVTAVRTGKKSLPHWQDDGTPFDTYDIKADALACLAQVGIDGKVQINTTDLKNLPAWYHPGRSAILQQGPKRIIGFFGELHPKFIKHFHLKGRPVVFELFMDMLPTKSQAHNKGTALLQKYQPVKRDFSFLYTEGTRAQTMIDAIYATDKKLISDVAVFDVYAGKGLPEDQKSISFSVTLSPTDKTLTDAEIRAIYDKIIENVSKKTGATFRDIT